MTEANRIRRAAYVGILTAGSTSRMRAEWLKKLTPDCEWTWVDTDPPMVESARLWRSLAFRFHQGKAVDRINDTVVRGIGSEPFDLIWVDKAVFLREETVKSLRGLARNLVHYTPDTAFGINASRNFEAGLPLFDAVVTTKSFDVTDYAMRIPSERIRVISQGYDPTVHFPRNDDASRGRSIAFVGLAEPDREQCLSLLLDAGIEVRLAGRGWSSFVRKNKSNAHLEFVGEEVFGAAYAEMLSQSWVGLGLLSKRFGELHTTRTFEIPACGAVLATERTSETAEFFSDSEAIFFSDYSELAARLTGLFAEQGTDNLARIANAGRQRVLGDGRDYPTMLGNVLASLR